MTFPEFQLAPRPNYATPWRIDTSQSEVLVRILDANGLPLHSGVMHILDARLIVKAAEMFTLLVDVAAVLDNYEDVIDGADGQPVPNRAMAMLREVETLLAEIGDRRG